MNREEPTTFTRTRLTWQAYLTIAYYSYLLNALGPITPFLREEMQLSYTVASFHFSAYALGVIVTGFLMGWAARRIGLHPLLWVGVFGMALGALLLVAGQTSPVSIAGAFFIGLLGVLISALFSSALAEQHGTFRAVALTESTMLASLFSALAPITVSFFARTPLTWRAALCLMVLAAPVLWLIYGKDRLESRPVEQAAAASPSSSIPAAKGPLPKTYWLYWTLAFLVEAIEFCIIFWAADYLEKVIGFSKANAALGVSAFMGAMLTGRWLVSRLLLRSQEQRILMISLFIAALGFLAFWLAPAGTALGSVLALLGLGVAGLGVAGLFPIINALALSSAPERMVEASGRISLAVGSSIFLLPLLLARLADWFGIRSAYGLEVALLAAAILLATQAKVRKPGALPQTI